eukprot:1159811-Pelagomonas_calceolata.AAC.3
MRMCFCRPGEWESVNIPFNELIYTVRGKVGSNQSGGRMPRHAVMAVGITLPVTKEMGEEGDFWNDGVASCVKETTKGEWMGVAPRSRKVSYVVLAYFFEGLRA